MTYLFYDIETTGLNKAFDQVLQFAAIRTDENLKPLERHQYFVRLNPDMVPAPEAMLTHQITFESLASGEKEYEAIGKIHALLNAPNTISIGYNTLGFDDEFLRFSFYRNLFTPYTHQFAKGCSRADLYPMMVCYHLFQPARLIFPTIDGKVSLKLEHLNQANHLTTGAAHDAMVDVEATLALARLCFQDRKMWDYLMGYFQKRTDIERQAALPTHQIHTQQYAQAIYLDGKFGHTGQFHAPVLALGRHRHYKNQTLWLRLDTENFSEITADNLIEKTWVIHKKDGEPGFLLPPAKRFLVHLSAERKAVWQANLAFLETHPDALHTLIEYHLEYKYPDVPNVDVEADLYSAPFWTPAETKLLSTFHLAYPAKKMQMAKQFQNSRMRALAIRLLARNYLDALEPAERENFAHFCECLAEGKIVDYRGNVRYNRSAAEATILKLQSEGLPPEKQALLAAYVAWNKGTIK